jgi:hypothetical protein
MTALHAQQDLSGFYPEPDTVPEIEVDYVPTAKGSIFTGRPGRAALYSLILPGAGQAYNKKYWQVPIVWAGVGTAGGIMLYNSKYYGYYRDGYRESLRAGIEGTPPIIPDGLPPKVEENLRKASTEQIKNHRDDLNRYRQISIVAFALTWIANSAHAYVSAHLKDFDISDDLSIQILPFSGRADYSYEITNYTTPISTGVVLRF